MEVIGQTNKNKKIKFSIKGQPVKPVGKTLAPEKRLERDSVFVGSGVGSCLAKPFVSVNQASGAVFI